MSKLAVLAFSGGLDTSWCVPYLQSQGYRVITCTVDTGFTQEEIAQIAQQSRALGAEEHCLISAKKAYFDEILRFLIAGNIRKGETYPLCVGAERSIQARETARLAIERGADVVVHGSTAAGNDQIRFDVAFRTYASGLKVLAPIRDLAPSRDQQVDQLKEKGLPIPAFGAAYSVNTGLWGVTIGGSETKKSADPLPESAWVRTRGAFESPKAPMSLTVEFEQGVPTCLDGRPADPVELIESLDLLAGSYGIGRGIHLGETILGIKGRVAFEAPAATVILDAHRELEKLVLTQSQLRTKAWVAESYGDAVHRGQWTDPVCRNLEAFLLSSQERVTGKVHLELSTGRCFVQGIESPYSLMAASRGEYGEAAGEWDGRDAAGFSKIYAIPSALASRAGGETQ